MQYITSYDAQGSGIQWGNTNWMSCCVEHWVVVGLHVHVSWCITNGMKILMAWSRNCLYWSVSHPCCCNIIWQVCQMLLATLVSETLKLWVLCTFPWLSINCGGILKLCRHNRLQGRLLHIRSLSRVLSPTLRKIHQTSFVVLQTFIVN